MLIPKSSGKIPFFKPRVANARKQLCSSGDFSNYASSLAENVIILAVSNPTCRRTLCYGSTLGKYNRCNLYRGCQC